MYNGDIGTERIIHKQKGLRIRKYKKHQHTVKAVFNLKEKAIHRDRWLLLLRLFLLLFLLLLLLLHLM